jgi:hypothetical protein
MRLSFFRKLAVRQNPRLIPWTAYMRRFAIAHGMSDLTFELAGVAA